MSNIDENIVKMTFDNANFESRLSNTLHSLDQLTASLKFQGAQDGFKSIAAAADSVNLASMSGALDNISSKFSAMGAIGFSIISNLTTSALHFAETVGHKVLDPLLSGGRQRAINLDNAKFAFQGLGIDVTAAMDSALSAVKGTAFGLDEAAKAAAQFGASGIGAGKDMTQSLRGIAGIAAMSNSSFSEIADIMTKAAAMGKVTNIDLQQFATRGLNAAAAYAKATGVTEAQVHEMATKGTLDYAKFAKAMDDTFGAHAQEADKTFSGAMGNMHAALSRLGAAFYIPQLENQRKILNAFSPVLDNLKTSLQPVLDMFTGFTVIKTDKLVAFLGALDFTKLEVPMHNFAQAFANIMYAIQAFITPVKQAFNEIIPLNAGQGLLRFSEALVHFTEKLKIGGKTVDEVRGVFYGLFSILDITWAVVKGVVGVIGDLLGALLPAGGGVLNFAAGLGENLRMLDATLVSGGKIQDFFDNLGGYLQKPIAFLRLVGSAIADVFKSFTESDAAETSLGRINARIDQTETSAEKLKDVWDTFTSHLSGVFNVLSTIWDYISNWFSTLGQKIAASFHPGDFDSAVDIVNVGLLGGIALLFKKFMQGGLDNVFSSGMVARVKAMLGGVTTTLKAMQTDLKADALLKIAAALALLAASLVVLSLIDSAALTKALTAMAVAFGEMVGVMALIDKLVSSNSAAIKLGIIGAALIEFSTAAGILTLAIRNLSGLSWDELVKGLVGVAGGLLIMVGASQLMADGSLGMIAAGAGMVAISGGLLILSEAVKSFASMSWGEIGKGLVGVAGGLILVTAALNFMPPSGVISGIGFIEVSAGLIILAQAVKQFGDMDWGTLGKGLLGIGAALLIVAAAMNIMPLDAPITAAGLLILAIALNVMAEAIKILGNMDMGTLAKGIGAVAAIMLILAIATNAMEGALPGAAALVVVSGALLILTHVMEKLGAMKTGDIIKALLALAGVLAVLGIAAFVMEPIIPALLGLGAAIALIGAGFALFGAGVWLVAKGLEELAASGVAGASAFVEMMKTVETAIPEILGALIKSIIDQGEELLKATPLLIRLIAAVLDQLLDTIIQLAPKLGQALVAVIKAALNLIKEEFPEYVKTGMLVLLSILRGIRDNIGEIVTVVADIVVNFLDALQKKVPEIVDAVYNFMVVVVTQLAGKIGESVFIFAPLAIAFMNGFLNGLENAVGDLFDFFVHLPGRLIDIIKAGLGIDSPSTKFMEIGTNIILGLINGLVGAVEAVITWFTELPGNILSWIGDLAGMELKGIEIVAGFLLGIVNKAIDLETWWLSLPLKILGWIGDVAPTLLTKGIDIITGFLSGVIQKAADIAGWFIGLPGNILGWLSDVAVLEVKGIEVIAGFLSGIIQKAADVSVWFLGLPGDILGWIGDLIGKLAPAGVDLIAGLLNGITDKFTDIISWLTDLPGKVIGYIPNPIEMLVEVGKMVMEGLLNGLKSGWDKVTGFLSSLNPVDYFNDINLPLGHAAQNLVPTGTTVMGGLHYGMQEGWKKVTQWLKTLDPSTSVVDTMTKRMNEALSQVAMSMNEMGDLQPRITPVLDLTNVKMGANDLNNMFNGIAIAPTASFDQARTIATTTETTKTTADVTAPSGPTEVTFNQYNTSPDALSTNDIYRNTKSQIALAKEELKI